MTKVLLVQPNFNVNVEKAYDACLPLPLIYIGTFLNKNGHEAKIFDRSLHSDNRDFIRALKQFNPDIVYTNVIMGRLIFDCITFSKIAKSHSDALVIWGGILPTLRPAIPLNSGYVDFVIRGETEETMLDIANTFKARKTRETISKLRNVNYNPSRPRMDLDLLAEPDYELVDVKKYTDFGVITSRGCPYRCAFCYIDGYWKSLHLEKWRGMSTDKAINMIRNLVTKYNIRDIAIYDDNFPTDKKRAIEIMHGISDLGLKIFILGRTNYCQDDIMQAYKKAGVWTIQIGFESGSQRMLNFMKKDVTVQQMKYAVKQCKKYKILCEGSFVIGFPEENVADLSETVKFIKQNTPDYAGIKLYHPYPETDFYDYCIKNRLITEPKRLEDWGNVSVFNWANINVSKIPTDVLMKTKANIERFLFMKSYSRKLFRMLLSGRIPKFSKILNASKHILSLWTNKPIQ
ncbi:MAG: radical SAM protein [Nanoarchaeota archaeon]